ncbi:MAG: hypothetical protein JSW51_01225 [Gemmatimonadota bacterium]|nr:MAG: hypothetical protein JSW51_01225 [Gemmatimonadota bacterium]
MEIFIIVVLIGVGVALAVAQSNKRKVNEAWRQAASRLQLRHNAGDLIAWPELYGRSRGCRVKITVVSKHQGSGSKKFTRYEITYPQALPFGLSLKEQTAFSGIRRMLGGQDIATGDPTFDDFVVVKSHDSVQATQFLTPARRLSVSRVLSMHPGAEITDSQVKWDSRGAEDRSSALVNNVDRLVDFAIKLTTEADVLEPSPEAVVSDPIPSSQSDDLEAVFTVGERSEPQEYIIDSVPQPPDPLTLEVEERKWESGTGISFDQIEQDIEELLEADAIPAEAPDTLQDGQATAPLAGGLDVHDLCRALFGSGKISFQINELFKQDYQGLKVQWSGKLTRVDSYPFDLVFGNDPGTKAEFEVAELAGDSVGTHVIKAVVQLAPEAYDQLIVKTGQALEFSGTLVKCDSFMKSLFLADGSATH